MAPLHKVLTVLALAFAAAFILLLLLGLADWPPTQGLTTLCLIIAIFVGAGAFAARYQKP